MNARIKELAEAAYREIACNSLDGVISREAVDQRFAELIVRECLVQIGNAIPDTDCSASGIYKTAKIAATCRVKEYFGVQV